MSGQEKITVVYGSDWEGIYVDGELASESHGHSAAQALESVGFAVETVTADEDWLNDRGSLPELLGECQLEANNE